MYIVMLTDELFRELVLAASLASSADNMQPWEFRKQEDTIEVYYAKSRSLPTDVNGMFGWIGIGAAIQNMVVAASAKGLIAKLEYKLQDQVDIPAAIIRFSPEQKGNHLEQWLAKRTTNRTPYEAFPLNQPLISKLTQSVQELNAGIHWTTEAADLDRIAEMDANSSYIRLEHKPLYDELFNILRFTQKEIETSRYGLDFASLEVPPFAVVFARLLQYRIINNIVSRLEIGRIIAKKLASRLRLAGGLCLITAGQQDPAAYMEAGRAMEQLWLTATSLGLSVQPYGVLPQYITKMGIEPETLLPKYVSIIKTQSEQFYSIFTEAKNEYPAILLRIGRTNKESSRNNIRLRPDQLIIK